MESGLIAASADALTACLLLLLYLPVAAFAWRMLIPDLPGPARLLVSGYLLAQVAVILLSFIKQPALSYDWWLWNLDREYNIPATLASMQLAMVAFVALLGAWRHSPRWQRLFFFGLALLFAFLAADEFYLLHEDDETGFALVYAALGMAVAVLTLIMAARAATRREKLWHGTFLAGLALSAFGAFGIDKALFTCDQWLIFRLDHCLYLVPLEEACEFLGIWLALLGLLGMALGMSRAGGSAMSRTVARLLLGWSFLWLLLLCLWSLAPGLELRLMTEPANVRFGSGTELHGYRVERRKHELFAHLIVSARQADYPWLGYSVVLVDQVTGAELARRDRFSRGQLLWHLGADWRHVFRETIPVLLPEETPQNRAYWIVLTQWREREGLYTTQSVEASDLPRLTETQIIIGEYLRPEPSNKGILDPLARFSNGFALVQADLPASAKAGGMLAITFRWQAEAAGVDDLIQFLHLGHSESGAWHVTDQQPLGARLPTRLWYTGLDDSEIWQLPLPADLSSGEYQVFTGLYRHSDGERLPAFDSDGGSWLDNRVALGNLIVE